MLKKTSGHDCGHLRSLPAQRTKLLTTIFLLMITHSASAAETGEMPLAPQADVVIIVGKSGTPDYGKKFADWSGIWRDVSDKAGASTTTIGQSGPDDSNDREQLHQTIQIASNQSDTPLWLVFIGHGTFARNTAKFNLRGPDVSATELAQWLQNMKRPIVIINCASSSGPFINQLSGPNRVIVTATKSGAEQNYARFGEFIAKAIASPDSDLDHDDEVSIQEAFLRASSETQQFYAAAGRISTEHALLDDNADGRGTPASMFRGTRPIVKAKDDTPLDGRAASRQTLTPTNIRLPFTPSELSQRTDLETQLEELRQQKSSLDAASYEAKLEPLLLQLARLYQAAEQRRSGQATQQHQSDTPGAN